MHFYCKVHFWCTVKFSAQFPFSANISFNAKCLLSTKCTFSLQCSVSAKCFFIANWTFCAKFSFSAKSQFEICPKVHTNISDTISILSKCVASFYHGWNISSFPGGFFGSIRRVKWNYLDFYPTLNSISIGWNSVFFPISFWI